MEVAAAAGWAGGECGVREERQGARGALPLPGLREAEAERGGRWTRARSLGQQGPHGASPGPPRQGLSCCHGNRLAPGAHCGLGGRDLKAGHSGEGGPAFGSQGVGCGHRPLRPLDLALQHRGLPGLRGVWQRGAADSRAQGSTPSLHGLRDTPPPRPSWFSCSHSSAFPTRGPAESTVS